MNTWPSLGFIRIVLLAISTLTLAGCTSSPQGIHDMGDTPMGRPARNQKRIEKDAIQRAEHQAERREHEAAW